MTDEPTERALPPDPAEPGEAPVEHPLDEPLTASTWEGSPDEPADGEADAGNADDADDAVDPLSDHSDADASERPSPDTSDASADAHTAEDVEAGEAQSSDGDATAQAEAQADEDRSDQDHADQDHADEGHASATDGAKDVPRPGGDGAEEPEPAPGPGPDADVTVGGAEPAESTTSASSPGGWTALGRALRPRLTKAQLLAGVLCAVLGFALVVQVQHHGDTSLEGMRQADLVRMLDETTDRGDALARQESNLAAERDELLSGSDRRQAALDALRRSATTQGILTGRLPAQGPGVIVTLTEPDGAIKPLTMLDVLEELRNAGAEAIQLNGHRITASSAFTGAPGAVVLDGETLSAPFTWIAIGEPDTIATALQIPGGAMAAVRNDGGAGTIARQDQVKVSAIRVVPDPVYATPQPAPTR